MYPTSVACGENPKVTTAPAKIAAAPRPAASEERRPLNHFGKTFS